MNTTYYVDATGGSDENLGLSIDKAWATLKRVEDQVFEAGDKILLKSGEVWCEGLKLHGQGRSGRPIYLGSYLVEEDGVKIGVGPKAKIQTEGKVLYGLHLHNLEFWEIENIEISNRGAEPIVGRTGIMVAADEGFVGQQPHYVQHIYLQNVYVHDVNGEPTTKDSHNGGIFYSILTEDTSNYLAFKDIRIEDCYIKDVQRTGISFGETKCIPQIVGEDLSVWQPEDIKPYLHQDIVIRNNYVVRSGGDAIVPMYAFRPMIEHNTSQEASFSTIDQPDLMFNAAIWPWQCYEAVFRYNEAFKTYLNGDGQGFDCDWSYGTLYEYNYSHHNEGGFMLVCQKNAIGAKVRNNISYNDQRCIFMTSNEKEAYVESNLIYTGAHLETKMFSVHKGPGKYENNIFYKEGKSIKVDWHDENNIYNNNFYHGYSESAQQKANKVQPIQLLIIKGIQTVEDRVSKSNEANVEEMMKLENKQRAQMKETAKIYYGVQRYALEQYKEYISCYKALLEQERIIKTNKISDEDVGAYYEANKVTKYINAEAGQVFAIDAVKDHIRHKLASDLK